MPDDPSPTPRFFRLLLRLYPRSFRERYGREMAAVFRREREASGGGPAFWARQTLDHLEAARAVRARKRREGRTMMGRLGDDLRSAFRSLVRAPGFALVAVGTLALGVGATAAVFTVVDRVLLRPLPYPGSERMALVGIEARHDPGSVGPLSPALLAGLQERTGPAEAVVAARGREEILRGEGDPERIDVTAVSEGFFSFFGARAAVGRLLRPGDHAPGAAPVAVLGHAFWQERFGGDPEVMGTSLRLGEHVRTVTGVLAPDFHPPAEIVEADAVWVPMEVDRTMTSSFFLAGIARLRAGRGIETLDAHADGVMEEVYADAGMPRFLLGAAVEPYRDAVVGPVSGALGRVLAGVGLLLVIACVNVAGLLLTRGAERRRELGVRAALGASRGRLVRQLVGESSILALAGGLAGGTLAWGAVELFRAHAPAALPRLAEVALDARGLAFALAVSVATVVLFGLLPALRSTRDLAGSRRSSRGATAGRSEGRLRTGLIAAETALAVVLAVGSALLAHDLARIATEETGFRPDGLVAVTLNLEPRYERGEWAPTWERLMEEAAAVPGVESVAVATQAPYDGSRMASTYRPEGWDSEEATFVITVAVGGDYLDALGTRLSAGRPLGPGDAEGEPRALVNEAFVERYWPDGSAVGRTVRSGEDDEVEYRVAGVVADVRTQAGEEVPPQIFLPLREAAWREMELLARTGGDAAALAPGLREAVRRVDPGLPVTRIRTLKAMASRALATPRFYATLFGGFAAIAVLLALVGVYGTTAYVTRSRLRETGIRLALGARRRQVVGELVARTGGAVGLGVAAGLAGAALAAGALSGTLHYVEPRDAPTYLLVALAVTAVGVVAAWIPARAASRADPVATLREE